MINIPLQFTLVWLYFFGFAWICCGPLVSSQFYLILHAFTKLLLFPEGHLDDLLAATEGFSLRFFVDNFVCDFLSGF